MTNLAGDEPTQPIAGLPAPQPVAPTQPLPAPTSAGSAAWLPDPWNAAQQRYWDGRTWTGHTAPAQVGGALQPYQPAPVPSRPVYGQRPAPYISGPATVVMNDARPNSLHATIAWIFAVVTIGYFLPWAVAATRGKSNAGAIGLLNFLLGWTFLGWLAALVMACGSHQSYAVVR